jgi:hypothetical protein
MKNDNKTTDIENESTQLGDKDENPSLDKTISNAVIAWTPGEERPFIANIFTKSGITKSADSPPKQGSPIQRPLYNNSGPDTL